MAAIVPATDAPPTLAQSLDAIRAAVEPPDELIVVDEPFRAGPAIARNLGVSRTRAEVVVFVDADVVVHADAFRRIRAAFAADPTLTALFGSYDDDPGAAGVVSDFRNLLHHHVHRGAPGPATTFWAGLGAVQRDAFLAVGGFDERRFPHPSVEDIDLGMRLLAHGGRIRLDPTIQGKHLKHWTLGSMVRTDLLRRGIPWVRLLLESGSSSTTLNLGWRNRASALSSGLLVGALLMRRPRTAGASAAVLILLNHSFYVLLWRRRGWRQFVAGVPLHVLHHFLSLVAVPAGTALYLRDRLLKPAD